MLSATTATINTNIINNLCRPTKENRKQIIVLGNGKTTHIWRGVNMHPQEAAQLWDSVSVYKIICLKIIFLKPALL